MSIREQADGGKPTALAEPESPIAMVYQELARHVGARIVLQEAITPAIPNITVSDDWFPCRGWLARDSGLSDVPR